MLNNQRVYEIWYVYDIWYRHKLRKKSLPFPVPTGLAFVGTIAASNALVGLGGRVALEPALVAHLGWGEVARLRWNFLHV